MATIDPNEIVKQQLAKMKQEDIENLDKIGGSYSKIEKSGIYTLKVVMAKKVKAKESDAANFKVEFETENGAKVYWESGFYLNKEGSPLTKDGDLLIGAINLAEFNYVLTGEESLPNLTTATIKETQWTDGNPKEVQVEREIARDLIGKFVLAQVVRIRTNKTKANKLADGSYGEPIVLNEETYRNEVRKFFNIDTEKTYAESKLGKEAVAIDKAAEWCDANPVLDKYKEVKEQKQEAPKEEKKVRRFGSRK